MSKLLPIFVSNQLKQNKMKKLTMQQWANILKVVAILGFIAIIYSVTF